MSTTSNTARQSRFKARKRREGFVRKEFWLAQSDWALVQRILRKKNAIFPNQGMDMAFIIKLAEYGLQLSPKQPDPPPPAPPKTTFLGRVKNIFSGLFR